MCEVCVCQAMTYAGDAAEARKRLEDLRRRAARSRNPSAIAWAHYVTGEATAEVDLPAALAAYRAAVEQSLKVDNRLFLGLARSAAVALAARQASPQDALAEFERVMGEWDELGNVAAQWWVLLQVSVLLTRLGLDRPAALLAGAFLAGGTATYMLLGDDDRLQASIAALTERLGEQTVRAAFAEGAALGFDEVAALAQRSITAARAREPAVCPTSAVGSLSPVQCRRMASMCRASVPQHPPSTVSCGSSARSAAYRAPRSSMSPMSSDSAASSSAWLIVEALARSPRTRPFQPSPAISVLSTCVGCAQLTM